jgi:hypothetical protein
MYHLAVDNSCKSVSSSIHTGYRFVKTIHLISSIFIHVYMFVVEPWSCVLVIIFFILPT